MIKTSLEELAKDKKSNINMFGNKARGELKEMTKEACNVHRIKIENLKNIKEQLNQSLENIDLELVNKKRKLNENVKQIETPLGNLKAHDI